MKKILLTISMLILLPGLVFAQNRGALPNVFASWYQVTSTQTSITLPYKARDIAIHNGSNVRIYVDLKGGTIPVNHVSASPALPSVFALQGNTALNLSDYLTDRISMKTGAAGTTASPVVVITTY